MLQGVDEALFVVRGTNGRDSWVACSHGIVGVPEAVQRRQPFSAVMPYDDMRMNKQSNAEKWASFFATWKRWLAAQKWILMGRALLDLQGVGS